MFVTGFVQNEQKLLPFGSFSFSSWHMRTAYNNIVMTYQPKVDQDCTSYSQSRLGIGISFKLLICFEDQWSRTVLGDVLLRCAKHGRYFSSLLMGVSFELVWSGGMSKKSKGGEKKNPKEWWEMFRI